MTQMIIELGDRYRLEFEIASTTIAELWLERMNYRHAWSMDNPDRFYGFNSFDDEVRRALTTMQQCIDTVNQHQHIIHQTLSSINDQDTLNYLHNIFERYHGQLDSQTHNFWKTAPTAVQQALANINITVHRCESLRNGHMSPRFVCTWYGMPKTQTLDLTLQEQHAVEGSEFGGVYLNYCEIGKTATDMAYDNDQYMADEMFQPFSHYSADFRVDLYTESSNEIEQRRQKTADYFDSNRQFFKQFGIESSTDIRIKPTKFKVAQLVYESQDKQRIISQIRDNQHVNAVTIK